MITNKLQKITQLLALSFQLQVSLAAGYLFCLLIAFYYSLNPGQYPPERIDLMLLGLGLSLGLFFVGRVILKSMPNLKYDFFHSCLVIIFTWLIAASVSGLVFALAGFPIPTQEFSFLRRFVDGFYESVSGFTTAGASVLPSVEVFPRSVLMWRSMTHFFGGMGIAYMTISFVKNKFVNNELTINAEAESPNYVNFKNEEEAKVSGIEFFQVYGVISLVLAALLFVSGILFRSSPYANWQVNLYDAVNYTFSVVGTGGFAPYDTSAGLPNQSLGLISGGVQNHVSEWIMAVFMIITGSNLGLWYLLVFRKKLKQMLTNVEFLTYIGIVSATTLGITLYLQSVNFYPTFLDSLRYAFFNVATIISTTGLGNTNFHAWPAGALAILFIVYFIGGMVGSTAGGPKVSRIVILYKKILLSVGHLFGNNPKDEIEVDGFKYDPIQTNLVILNVLLYYIIFFVGAILIVVVSPTAVFADGTTKPIDLVSGIVASIANLGNIGPTALPSVIDSGPTGNYFAYSEAAKVVMSFLMLIGRLGVYTFMCILVIFMTGTDRFAQNKSQREYDKDSGLLRQ
jgi:trk system potassium uptake protein